MEETLLGLPLDSLACAPFMPSEILKTDYSSQDSLWNGTLDFLPSDVRIRLFPVIGAFVGGDITAGVLTADILTARKNAMLLLDLGTNGEMVLETPTERFACATAAGPCFEGANISCGMCAESGAVTFIENRNGKFYAETLDNLPIRGICGSALIDLTAELLRIGLLTPDGRLLEPSELTNDFPSSWASHISATGFQLAEGIFVTPHDFRELQLAVGAIRTGIKLLLRRGGLDPQNLSHFLISGGFGSGVRMHNAQTIGLIPATISPQVFQFIGNSSLSGAVLATMSEDFWRTAHRIATETVCLDLSLEPDFSDVFMDSMTWEAY